MSRPLGSFLKENAVLIAGIALPLMLVILFTFARALPAKNVPDPQYKAVYALQPYYGGFSYAFKIKDDGKLDVTFNTPDNPNNYVDNTTQKAQIFIFDGAKNKTQTIDLDLPARDKEKKSVPIAVKEFDTLTLASGDAPDGYKFREESYSGSSLITEIFTYRSRHIPRAIVKEGREIPLENQNYGNFVFIGWVTKE
jgi:hypothetical protein